MNPKLAVIEKDHVEYCGYKYPFYIAAKYGLIEPPKAIFTHSSGYNYPILIAEKYGWVTSEYVGECIQKEMQEKNKENYLDSALL